MGKAIKKTDEIYGTYYDFSESLSQIIEDIKRTDEISVRSQSVKQSLDTAIIEQRHIPNKEISLNNYEIINSINTTYDNSVLYQSISYQNVYKGNSLDCFTMLKK